MIFADDGFILPDEPYRALLDAELFTESIEVGT
jgi:hypothetical protein